MSRIYLNNLTQVKKVGDTLYIAKNNVQDSSSSELVTALPLGYIFTYPFSVPPDGCIIANGAEYSRELYSDLWAYYSSKTECTKTDDEWQSIASANNGYCPYFSSGDGSSTFRVPKFAPYQQLAISAANAGMYHQAGLPNITASYRPNANVSAFRETPAVSGAFKVSEETIIGNYGVGYAPLGAAAPRDLLIDASECSPVYGRSDIVQPESHEWIVCVVAYGKITNVGETDVSAVMQAIGVVQSNMATLLPNTTPHIVEVWNDEATFGRYRLYSDGWLEQYGFTYVTDSATIVSLYKEYKDTKYDIKVTQSLNQRGEWLSNFIVVEPETSTTGFTVSNGGTINNNAFYWSTKGYIKE